jgi:hypothetical protein
MLFSDQHPGVTGMPFFFSAAVRICLAGEWSGISSRFDRIEDYIGALLPMSWAFAFIPF